MKPELAKALLAAQKAMPHLTKTTEGQEGRRTYKYLPLDQLLDAALPVLHKNGLVLYQAPIFDGQGNQALRTALIHETGEEISDVMPIALAEGAGAKAQGSAISYARRYALLAALGLAPDEDDDGTAATNASKKAEAKRNGAKKYSSEQREKLKTMIQRLETNVPREKHLKTWMQDAQAWTQENFSKDIAELDAEQMNALIERAEKWIEEEALPIA